MTDMLPARFVSADPEADREVDPLAHAPYRVHVAQWGRVAVDVDRHFRGFTNADKLATLLEFWLFAHRCFVGQYGTEAAAEFSRSAGGSHLRFAWYVQFGADIRVRRQEAASTWASRLAADLLPAAFLPGGRVITLRAKLLWRLTRFVTRATASTSAARRSSLRGIVGLYFDDLPAVAASCAEGHMPDVFVASEVRTRRRAPLPVDCTTNAFLDFCGFEKLLLLDRRLDITGRQHGGGYDIFGVDYWVDFEKQLSDRFIGWGLSRRNARQHKYPRGPVSDVADRLDRRVVFVERPLYPAVMKPLSPPIYAQFMNQRAIDYIVAELRASRTPYVSLSYPGALRSTAYDGRRGAEISSPGKGESVLRRSDVVIFDCNAASMIHYCIEQDIVFMLVFARDDMRRFSGPMREWMSVLHEYDLAFVDDEIGRLSAAIAQAAQPHYAVPAAVKQYHRRVFIDLPDR